jgi:hypothetical protein
MQFGQVGAGDNVDHNLPALVHGLEHEVRMVLLVWKSMSFAHLHHALCTPCATSLLRKLFLEITAIVCLLGCTTSVKLLPLKALARDFNYLDPRLGRMASKSIWIA